MSFLVLLGALEQGLIYALVALGIYISYRTLDIADLTTDGTFALGAAVSATLTVLGHPVLGMLLAVLAGAAAGGVTAVLQTKLGVQPILAGIITMTALYSVNLMVMGNKPNVPMLQNDTIFSLTQGALGKANKIILCACITGTVAVILALFLKTQLGLSLRATGNNRAMVAASSINPAFTTAVGLCIANGVVALSGAVLAQYQRFSASDIGSGKVVLGLASLIIGEVIFTRRGGVVRSIAGAITGGVIYWLLMTLAMTSSLVSASNLKLVSAIIVAAAISYPAIGKAMRLRAQRKAARNA